MIQLNIVENQYYDFYLFTFYLFEKKKKKVQNYLIPAYLNKQF